MHQHIPASIAAQGSMPIREDFNGCSYYGSFVGPTHYTAEPSARPTVSLIAALVWLRAFRSCFLASINEPLQVFGVLLSELSSVRREFAVAWSRGYCCICACFLLSTSNPRMVSPPPTGSFLPSSDARIIVSFAQFRLSPQIQFQESIAPFHLFVFSSIFLHRHSCCCVCFMVNSLWLSFT